MTNPIAISAVVKAVAEAIKEGAGVYHTWLKGADRRRLSKAIDNAEKYIFTNEDNGLTASVKAKLLRKYRKLFFRFNN